MPSVFAGSVGLFLDSGLSTGQVQPAIDAFNSVYGRKPSASEVSSWERSWPALAAALEVADMHGCGILLEYQLPMTSQRVDCIVTGAGRDGTDSAVVIELKQWVDGLPSEIDDCVEVRGEDTLHPPLFFR